MKQFIKTITAIFFVSICILASSSAQNITQTFPYGTTADKFAQLQVASVETMAEVNFALLFPNASRQKWSFAVTGSFVSFCNGDRPSRAAFNANGKINYVVTDCDYYYHT